MRLETEQPEVVVTERPKTLQKLVKRRRRALRGLALAVDFMQCG